MSTLNRPSEALVADTRAEWPRALLVAWVAVLAAGAFAYRDAWAAMVGIWAGSDKYQHGFAIAPMAAWAAWEQRRRLAGILPSPSWRGMLAVVACGLAWTVGMLAGINSAMQIAAVGMIGAGTWAMLGDRVARAMAFPLLFLFFMVPVGEGLSGLLMSLTADVLEWLLRATGIPVLREDFEFTLPTGRWSVIEACGGLNYLIAAVPLAVFCAHTEFRRASHRIAFVALAVSVALVANWLRAYLVVMIGHLSDMRWGVGTDHLVYGWVLFGIVMAAVFALARILGDRVAHGGPGVPAVALAPSETGRTTGPGGAAAALAVLAVLASLGVSLVLGGTASRIVPRADFAGAMGRVLGDAPGRPEPAPVFEGHRESLVRRIDDGAAIDVFVAYYAGQTQGRELIAYGNRALARDDKRWKIFEESVREVGPTRAGHRVRIVEYHARHGDARRLIWHWYVVGGVPRSDAYSTKAATLAGIVSGRGDHSAVAVLVGDSRLLDVDALRARMVTAAIRVSDALEAFTGVPGTESR